MERIEVNVETGEAKSIPLTAVEIAEAQAQQAKWLAERAANAYKDQRAAAYPSIADQLDQIYHDGLDAWKATILAVKQEFPKP
jgi:hypothetical protein